MNCQILSFCQNFCTNFVFLKDGTWRIQMRHLLLCQIPLHSLSPPRGKQYHESAANCFRECFYGYMKNVPINFISYCLAYFKTFHKWHQTVLLLYYSFFIQHCFCDLFILVNGALFIVFFPVVSIPLYD